MLTVNVKETGNENKKEDTLTIHGTTIKEQNGLTTDEFKHKKKKEIKKKLENLTKKVKEDAKNKDWESRLIDIISIVPSGLINILAEFYMQDSWKKISVFLVFVIVFIMLLFFLRKLVNNYIREKKYEILRYEMEIYFSEREKKEGVQKSIDAIEYRIKDQKFQEKQSWDRVETLLKIWTVMKKGIVLSIFVVGITGLVNLGAAVSGEINVMNTNTIENSVTEGEDVEVTPILEETSVPEVTPISEVTSTPEETPVPEIDETEEAFRYLWNVYLGNLEIYEPKDTKTTLIQAREFCKDWVKAIKDTDSWAYTDMEMYSWNAFSDTFLKEKKLSENNNVNASILLELGKSYSNAIDDFLESNNDSNITERTIGLACLRGTDIYMGVLRCKVTRNSIKEECYKNTAILLREFADAVYENKKNKKVDKQQRDEYSAKEFVLYIYSAVCYEKAAKYGDISWKKEAQKMQNAAKENWEAFKEYVP